MGCTVSSQSISVAPVYYPDWYVQNVGEITYENIQTIRNIWFQGIKKRKYRELTPEQKNNLRFLRKKNANTTVTLETVLLSIFCEEFFHRIKNENTNLSKYLQTCRERASIILRMTTYLFIHIEKYTLNDDMKIINNIQKIHENMGITTQDFVTYIKVMVDTIFAIVSMKDDEYVLWMKVFSKLIGMFNR